MDWDLKTTSWNFADMEKPYESNNTGTFIGSTSVQIQEKKGDCLADLKLGRLNAFEDRNWEKCRGSEIQSMMSQSLSMKRARAQSGNLIVSCLVDGCEIDLSSCKEYHRRHKVCEVHSKTPKVIVGGQEQRFCQQCSRFHLLEEFDDVKRSCRRRLDGHNRRRRKPQPDSLSANTGNIFLNQQGTKFSPHTYTNSLMEPSLARTITSEEENAYLSSQFSLRHSSFPIHFACTSQEGKEFTFPQRIKNTVGSHTISETPVCQTQLGAVTLSDNNGDKLFPNGLTRVLDSDCALSLLSSPPSRTSGYSLNHMVAGMQCNGLDSYSCPVMEEEPVVLVSDDHDSSLQSASICHGSRENDLSLTIPFPWQLQ